MISEPLTIVFANAKRVAIQSFVAKSWIATPAARKDGILGCEGFTKDRLGLVNLKWYK